MEGLQWTVLGLRAHKEHNTLSRHVLELIVQQRAIWIDSHGFNSTSIIIESHAVYNAIIVAHYNTAASTVAGG